jgi:hypothetical protein
VDGTLKREERVGGENDIKENTIHTKNKSVTELFNKQT